MLKLSKDTVITLLRWAERHPTIEVTGVVVAHDITGEQRIQPMRNIAKDPARYYAWDPAEMVGVWASMDDNQEHPLAIYHSHPGGKPDPSESDMEGALMENVHYLILYPDASLGIWRISAWECLGLGLLVGTEYEVAS